jgi:hypothetical protein
MNSLPKKVNISRLPYEKEHAAFIELPFKQALIQRLIEAEGELSRERIGGSHLRFQQLSSLPGQQIIVWFRYGNGKNWTSIIIHQDCRRPTNILKFEPYGGPELNVSDDTVLYLELMPDDNGMEVRSFYSNQAVLSDLRGSLGGSSGSCSLGDRLFHIGRLLVSDSSQRGSFFEQSASAPSQYNRERGNHNSRDSADSSIVDLDEFSQSERTRYIISGLMVIFGGLAAVAGAVAMMIWSRKVKPRGDADKR